MTRVLWPDLAPSDAEDGWLIDVPAVKSDDVLTAIARRHPMDGFNGQPGRWVFCREVSASTGGYSSEQRFDAVAVGLVPSVKYARVVYEVKVSRADWLREQRPRYDRDSRFIDDPGEGPMAPHGRWETVKTQRPGNKWDAALAVSTEYWLAAPPRCILPDELPPEAGLLEVRPWGADRELRARIVRPAPVRQTPNPDAGFWAAVLRRAAGRYLAS